MSTKSTQYIFKTLKIVALTLLICILAVPALIYVPFIQDFAKEIALREVKKSTGLDITIGTLRLRPPLNVHLDDVAVLNAPSDTMATLGNANISLRLLPLLSGKLLTDGIELNSVSYRMGTPDSILCLRAEVQHLQLNSGKMHLKEQEIILDRALLDGARINLLMKDTVTPEKVDTATASPLLIRANEIELRNVVYTMQMLPAIDSIGADIPLAHLADATVDMRRSLVHAKELSVDSVSAAYFTPAVTTPSKSEAENSVASTSASIPWTVTADKLRLSARSLTYGVTGAKPSAGFDPNHINVTNVAIAIDSLFNRGTEIRVPIRQLSGLERSGLELAATGLFAMDSTRMQARDFDLRLGRSHLIADANMGMGNLATDPSIPMTLLAVAQINIGDIEMAFPSMAKTLRGLPRKDITLAADINGTVGEMNISRLSLDWPSYLDLAAHGSVSNITDMARAQGDVTFNGHLRNINVLKPTLLDAALSKQINLPPMTIQGAVNYRPNITSGALALRTGKGKLAADGRWESRREGYSGTLTLDDFPVNSFLPSLDVKNITATMNVDGHGLDPHSPNTEIHTDINLSHIAYRLDIYKDVQLCATLSDGNISGTVLSHNPGADLDAEFTAQITKERYDWDVKGDVRHLDLVRLGVSQSPMAGNFNVSTTGSFAPSTESLDAKLTLTDLQWTLDSIPINIPSLNAMVKGADSITIVRMATGDLRFGLYSPTSINTITTMASSLTPFLRQQIADKSIDVRELQAHIPPHSAQIRAGRNNVAAQYLSTMGIQFSDLVVNAHNDSLMTLHGCLNGFAKDDFRLDSITFNASQHGKFLMYQAGITNRPGTLDDFASVKLNGYIANDKASILFNQHNLAGEQGFYFGLNATTTDSIVSLKMVPYTPKLANQTWQLNRDNFISFNYITKQIDSNLCLISDRSKVHLYTNHVQTSDSTTKPESLTVSLENIHLQDWLSISPFAPPVKGDLGAELTLRNVNKRLVGNGMVNLKDLYYGRERVGTFDLGLNLSTTRSGLLNADVALMVDSVKVMTAQGAINDTTLSNPLMLDFRMIRFPLHVANPFIPKDVAQLKGMLNGTMKITGSMEAPVFDGHISFDTTAVTVGITGQSYSFSNRKIDVDSSIVKFRDFAIGGLNNRNLLVNGDVNISNLTNVGVDLHLKANNMQIVNSTRPRGASLYGKAFIDLDATARGNLSYMGVNASLALLPETDVTYVLTASQSALTSQSQENMVQFMRFNDTTTVVNHPPQKSPMLLNLNAKLNVMEGSTLNVDISTDGKNKAQIKGYGILDYTLNPMNDGRLLGRFNINSGFARYTPPLMSEKNFAFSDESYINFTGDILNPTLNLHAQDEIKANVTQEGQNSRLVNFQVSVAITRTLQDMEVAFDLATNDDITISNELASMTDKQRANQAMNMLLYGVYTGPGTKGDSNIAGNPLFTFLESQVNSWAAKNINFVDISFGIDKYNSTTDGQSQSTTSYSYQVSKTLFNNRFKIVVGGNYSTDADTDENFSQNMFNNISFEYMLNRSGSMYVKLFRQVGYESILEGEVTQTGAGFVYRHKINSLRDLFRWRRTTTPSPTDTTKAAE